MLARFPRRPSLTLVGAVALVIAMANPAVAPPGDLDTTFDGDGRVTTDFAGRFDGAESVAIQGDGKIVVAGQSFVAASLGGGLDFALARYNADGSLDTTFGGDGKVTTDFAGGHDIAHGVAIQGDGRIVAAGCINCFFEVDGDFALARYNTNGSLDTTFDGDGKVTTDLAGDTDEAYAVAIQGDGKIVAAGFAFTETFNFALARYDAAGSLDTTFDTDGLVITDFTGLADGIAIQGDGKIVAAGSSDGPGGLDFALARYNTNGSLDTTFDGDGKVTTDFAGNFDQGSAVAIQVDGRIIAAGLTEDSVSGAIDFALTRYNTDGSLDTTFSGDGRVTTDFAGDFDWAQGVAIQGDGKIVAAGFAGFGDFALARYNTNGSLDPTFSGDGKVTTDFAGDGDEAHAVAIQGDGKIVAAGCVSCFSQSGDFALARYTCIRRTSRPTSIPVCP